MKLFGNSNAVTVAVAAAMLSFAGFADMGVSLPHRPSDGYNDVRRANQFGDEGNLEAGRAFIAELRARPPEKRNLEERQSVDMAEFAFLSHDLQANRARCIECLRAVCEAGPASLWGWAAHWQLKELGVEMPEPPKDPMRGLGAWGDGVINLDPKRLEPDAGRQMPDAGWLAAATNEVPTEKLADLKPGSSVRRAILRKRLVETCGEAKIREILAAKGGEELFARIWNDDAVLEDFLLSGPVPDAPLALETLMTLFLNDGEGWSNTPMGRRATVAVAINSHKGDDMTATVRHWAAFRRIGTTGRFVPETAKRDCREWRFIVRRPVDSADILYLNAAVKFPKRYITNLSLKNIPYRKTNCFGVRKWAEGGVYYKPWLASGLPRMYLLTRVGGVCEEQSTWAALCANAHGIMALPAGQPKRKATKYQKALPSHLCWLLREEGGNWRIVNGVTPYTRGRFTLWGSGFQYIQSTERAFADRVAHDESELLRFAGRIRDAAMRCPYNYPAWRAYADSLKAANVSIDEWRTYLGELLKLQAEGRLVTWDFAHEALDAMAAKGMKKAALAKETAKVFVALPQPKSRIAEEMDFRKDALARAMRRFKGNVALEDKVLSVAIEANKGSSAYLPQIFAFALERFGKDRERLGRLFSLAISLGGNAGGDGAKIDWRRIFAMGAFKSDRTAFRMMADFRNESDPPAGTAKVPEEDYGAPLVSDDALFVTSSSGKADTPEDYARVSDATPYDPKRTGLFVTKAEDDPWAMVEMAGAATIKGVSVVGAPEGLSVWISDDGEEWRKVGGGAMESGTLRIDMRGNPQTAKLVKAGFEQGGGKRPLRFKKMLVYGDKLY